MLRQPEAVSPELSSQHILSAVERVMSELRRGYSVCVQSEHGNTLMLAAEALTAERLAQLAQRTDRKPYMAITGQRARVLGLSENPAKAVRASLAKGLDVSVIEYLADPCTEISRPEVMASLRVSPADSTDQSCLILTKLSRLLPAAILVETDDVPDDVLCVDAQDINTYQSTAALSLKIVSQARVPLEATANARIIAFRPANGGIEHLAIMVGEPDLTKPVLIRIHSECFTGDLLGSLRCDCGHQLQGAIAGMAQAGGGIVLYLAQEGRGIGLINKLRAYQLQDAGYDTVDANLHIGYDEDERIYLPAARMLELLGVTAVRLMTNNPTKVAALTRYGISVSERVPHIFPSNEHNENYLNTKATRAGHIF